MVRICLLTKINAGPTVIYKSIHAPTSNHLTNLRGSIAPVGWSLIFVEAALVLAAFFGGGVVRHRWRSEVSIFVDYAEE